ncbi:uncharacterized protein LOC130494876 [Raphanus sativus]|uniref:Uncharacterized protein LOC130494876 n=1 Tax=Raphanus sativus TaxID=3726 RepID=A0A9W3BR73_RAPSA|nr:uncharacterized protein LOC130494876 [Raphanus sativus]
MEQYAKSGDDYEWIPSDGRLYGISFKTSSLDEITYSFLKERICKKKSIDPCLKGLNLSYIPLVVEPKINHSEAFSIRTYMKMHSCSRATSSTRKKRKVTPRCVAAIVHKDYPRLYETATAKILVSLVKRRLGVEVSYTTCLRGKKQAVADLRGDPEKGYKIFPAYLYMLEKVNPDTRTSLLLDKDNRFRYLFIALGASIEGFEYMRKVITVDATFLKTVEGGYLIIATAQDPNLHHYPIAFDVVDGEKNESWKWFFMTLKTVIPDSTELVFVSDRNASLIKAVAEVYLMSKHGYCI